MNKLTAVNILGATIIAAAFLALSSNTFNPKVEAVNDVVPVGCAVQHWNKIIFQIEEVHSTEPPFKRVKGADLDRAGLDGFLFTPLAVVVNDDPNDITNLINKLQDFVEKKFQLKDKKLTASVKITDIKYGVVCVGASGVSGQ